jgi:hypothetical protein
MLLAVQVGKESQSLKEPHLEGGTTGWLSCPLLAELQKGEVM